MVSPSEQRPTAVRAGRPVGDTATSLLSYCAHLVDNARSTVKPYRSHDGPPRPAALPRPGAEEGQHRIRLDNGRDRRDGEAEESLDIDAGQDDDS